jgi:hypothetical protein
MHSKKTLNQSIIDITNRIYFEYPELINFIKEIPSISTESDDEKISNQNLVDYYNSLHDIITQYSKTHLVKAKKNKAVLVEVFEYPYYGESEDIYTQSKEEQDIDPENSSKNKSYNKSQNTQLNNTQSNSYGSDLDVPGSELDDEAESTGNEDEENNYYSLGGDNHNDLEEDKGE